METKLKVCMLGAGFIARTHVAVLSRIEGVSLAGICAPDEARAQDCAKASGCDDVRLYRDFEAMLARETPDVLYVCVPPFAHGGQVEAAAARGVHVFLEKPLALAVERGAAMVEAVERAGIVTQVGYHMRFHASVRRMKALLDGGEAGAPTQFLGRYWCNMEGADWWRLRDRSGGQILEQTIHLYDLALHFLGAPASVCARLANLVHRGRADYTIEDTSAAMIAFQNGSVASISGSNCALPMHFLADFRLVCERALFDYRSTGQHWVEADSATIWRHDGERVSSEAFVETDDPYAAEDRHFIACVRAGRPTEVPARVGLESVRLVSAAIAAAASGAGEIPCSATSISSVPVSGR
jgi:predicted dehydrogenase